MSCLGHLDQVAEDRAALKPTALADRADPLDPAAAAIRLGAELGLSHDHRVAHGALGGVVGGLDALDLAEGPKRLELAEQAGAEVARALLAAAGSALEQAGDPFAKGRQLGGEPGELMAALEIGAVDREDLARGPHELASEPARGAGSLGDLDQLADHMRPAELLLEQVEEVIGGVAVGDRDPAEVLAEELLRGSLGARGVDPIAGEKRRGGEPDPLLGARKAPARLVGMDHFRLFDRLAQLRPRVGEGTAHPDDRLIDGAERDRDPEEIADGVFDLAAREPVDAGESGDVGVKARAEGRGPDPVGELGRAGLGAARAEQAVKAMLEDKRRDLGQLPDLMAKRFCGGLLGAREAVPALALRRQVLEALVDALGRRQLAGLALVAGLAARLAQRALVGIARRPATLGAGLQRIGGGWVGAVLGVPVQPALKLSMRSCIFANMAKSASIPPSAKTASNSSRPTHARFRPHGRNPAQERDGP